MIKVKISVMGAPSEINLSQFLGNENNVYKNCKFYVNEKIKEADFWFIFDQVNPDDNECYVSPKNVFLLVAEVAHPKEHFSYPRMLSHLKQFNKVYTCYETYSKNEVYALPFLSWMINANHGDSLNERHLRDFKYFSNLKSLPKSEKISVFCSNRAATESHRQRLRFVHSLKNHFKDKLVWYGNGVNQIAQKWDGIAPFKYHIALENQSSYNVITEKLYDSFLGLSYPIYHGAPNVNDYFSSKSMTSIDIKDLQSSIMKIEELIDSNIWEKNIDYIIESKNKCINEFNVYHRIAEICMQSNLNVAQINKEKVKLNSVFTTYDYKRLLHKLSNVFIRVGRNGKKISMS
jgi:hypothetical protein